VCSDPGPAAQGWGPRDLLKAATSFLRGTGRPDPVPAVRDRAQQLFGPGVPADIKVIEIPLATGCRSFALYIRRTERIDAAMAAAGWRLAAYGDFIAGRQ